MSTTTFLECMETLKLHTIVMINISHNCATGQDIAEMLTIQ